jgi:uncharacterized protein (TIGR02001 family)
MGRLGVALLALHACAQAQVSGSVALVSDYQYRGVSHTSGAAAPQLTLAYDHPDGWYVAGFASRIRPRYAPSTAAQYIGYAGFARRLASGRSWEAGVASYALPASSELNYREVFGGLASERVSARLSYSPSYLGTGTSTAYAEVNASHPLRENLRLFAHGGYLASLDEAWGTWPVRRADARIGLGLDLREWQVQLSWNHAHRRRGERPDYAAAGSGAKDVVLSIARRF